MEPLTLRQQFGRAAWNGEVSRVRELAVSHPELIATCDLNYLLRTAASHDHVELMEQLVAWGADINAPGFNAETDPEGPIYDASSNGAFNAVRWLLDHGATVNFVVGGVARCFSLTSAAHEGHLPVVKLLVERGADVHAAWNGVNAVDWAIMYNQKEVETYLRSLGLTSSAEQRGEPVPAEASDDPFVEHLKEYLGTPEKLMLQEMVPADPPISIYRVRTDEGQALVTRGMGSKPMTVPPDGEDWAFAELVMYLPSDWPLDLESLKDPKHGWPIEWLRRIARYPHHHKTWLGGRSCVIANDEPPKPVAPNTKLSCFLLMANLHRLGTLVDDEANVTFFYELYPLYTEERDLEKRLGWKALIERFQQYDISRVVDVRRTNVAR